MVNEPYYNEAGFDSDRGLQEGYENSRCYNEMALIKMVQSMTQLLHHPVEVFKQEIQEHFALNGWRLVHRLEAWLELNEAAEKSQAPPACCRAQHAIEEPAGAAAHRSPSRSREEPLGAVGSILEEEPDPPGPSPSPEDGRSRASPEPPSPPPSLPARCGAPEPPPAAAGGPPVVRPKKRRKSYRSFLPEGGGYPDIGFPLFPVSKGFVKSVGSVLQQYRAALAAAGLAEHADDK